MNSTKKRAKAAAMRRPTVFWIAVGATLAALAWWALRLPVQTASASDTQDEHEHDTHEHDVHDAHDHDAHDHDHHHPGAGEGPTAQITVWTEQFEIFAEHPLPVAGEPVTFIVHVTDQQTFLPRTEGPAKFILRHGGTVRATHVEPTPARPGIYTPELTFPLPAEWALAVAIPHAGGEHVVELPPLRERIEDLAELSRTLVARTAEDMGRSAVRLTPPAIAALRCHTWPHNLRELQVAIEKLVAFAQKGRITREDVRSVLNEGATSVASLRRKTREEQRQELVSLLEEILARRSSRFLRIEP